jgi:hypothetical protein
VLKGWDRAGDGNCRIASRPSAVAFDVVETLMPLEPVRN